MPTLAGFATLGSVVFAVAGIVMLLLITLFTRRAREAIELAEREAFEAAQAELGELPEPVDTVRTIPRAHWIVLGCFAMAAVLGVLGAVQRSPDSADRLAERIQALEHRLIAAEVELETRAAATAALDTIEGRSAPTTGGGTKREPLPKGVPDVEPRPEATSPVPDAPPPVADTSRKSPPSNVSTPKTPARSSVSHPPKVSVQPPSVAAPAPSRERDARRPASPPSASPATTGAEGEQTVAYHSPERLLNVRKGQAKEAVFGLFGTAFENREGKLVEIKGMRLIPSGPSATGTRFEVSQVRLGEDDGPTTSYWFLFEAGRLLTWGRPEEWRAMVSSYKLDVPNRLDF
jgi:hypothetical protein